jgi:transcriptional regulator of acetoin/glycerol metabolism
MRQAYEHLLERGTAPVGVREAVADSWLRSVAAGVDVDASRPPITLDRDLLTEYRAEHPLAMVFPLLYDVLGRAAEECDSIMAVSDARGQLLWVRGHGPLMFRQSGGCCDGSSPMCFPDGEFLTGDAHRGRNGSLPAVLTPGSPAGSLG